ncbi:MAG: phosphomannomutase/phosphoglucomutase [Cyanobacteria bacterium]|nr:phosphomannomutase/phosphoglucomutase [Cyanobacteria bacterium CG_2015-16_32_12]NCO78738.1 phosphomannomutase/phosphoglucomutase [Cyanobacteria bacterium CG_2015-22_32_23]NCQ03124.1 phosphomannomutase/phosphoglucomutase [Cyanobacteria bacterium CG_2015-09_32_10]NCQ41869.1 phosphomannomutase/phosphoglucomutase [Cyanobacteria bacterium CG_2015-04_32_10]NCS83607.1 phosphomannomutase/phosphoglucomutase [Cyanobacteria bacterium CG_2015-02_32_10]
MTEINWQKLQNGSDIRGVALTGVAGEEVNLTPEVVAIISKAFSLWLSQQKHKPTSELTISLGRDSRLSGETLMNASLNAIASLGVKVYDFAMASTPAMFMSTITEGYKCDGAIMLTASHLPFNRNGLKFFTDKGGLEKQDITEILAIAQKREFPKIEEKGNIEKRDFMSVYANQFVTKIRESVNHPDNYETPLQGLKIIVDAGNGAGGFYATKVLLPLGADIQGSQFLNPDGNFPNHIPNPENKEAMMSISEAVINHQADFGIIFDTDVDRSAAVDSQGKELNRNKLIALISAIILKEHPQSTIVTDSITSDGLTQFIEEELKGKHHRFKRGYKNVINEALRLNQEGVESWLAIETSGHAALKENYFLDDGAYLVTKLLIELAKLKLENKNLIDLINRLKEPVESEEFRLIITAKNFKEYGTQIIEKLTAFSASQTDWNIVPNNYEGIRISCENESEKGWFLLRLSLHDPVLPLNIETNIEGGVNKIASRLWTFFDQFEELNYHH